MAFCLLVLFCLAQNSGVFKIFEQLHTTSNTVLINSTTIIDSAAETGHSQVQKTEFQQCELSEKSIRVCFDEPSLIPLLVLLFAFPAIPFVSRVLQRALNVPVLPKPRRIHLSLCRFQE